MQSKHVVLVLSLAAALAASVGSAGAHGLAGKRFFPATLGIDDPFVADELSQPTIFHIQRRGDGDRPPTRETEVSGEFSKPLSPNLGFSIGGAWRLLDPGGGESLSGLDNPQASPKYAR